MSDKIPDDCSNAARPDELKKINNPDRPATYQVYGMNQELATDVLRALSKLPHNEVDTLIRRVATCQVINVSATH